MLLHGSGSNSATWMGDAAAYAEQCQVYAVDIPGEPGKSAPDRFSWTGRPSTSGWTMSWIVPGWARWRWAACRWADGPPSTTLRPGRAG
ncbi:MAG: hypothetical protein R3A10_11470 [Caldilineaceae bacterium]